MFSVPNEIFRIMIDKFLDYIKVEKRYSENTFISYKKDLEDFLLFVSQTEGIVDLVHLDKKVIRNFIVSLSEKNSKKEALIENCLLLEVFICFS